MFAEKVTVHYSAGDARITCADVLRKLDSARSGLRAFLPDEFGPPDVKHGGGESDESDSDSDLDRGSEGGDDVVHAATPACKRGRAAGQDLKRDGELSLTADPEDGWRLVAGMQWRGKLDGELGEEAVLANFHAMHSWVLGGRNDRQTVLAALQYWLDSFAARAAVECEGVAGWSRGRVYQLIAHGKEMFEAALRDPDLLEFHRAQEQDIDLQELLTRAQEA